MSPDPLTRRAIAVRCLVLGLAWIVLSGVMIAVGGLISHSVALTHFDRHITSWIVAHRTPALDTAMKAITWLGSWVAVAVTGGIVLALVVIRRLPPLVLVLTAVAWVGEVTIVNVVKKVVGRQRPPQNLWLVKAHGGSFPSGHAANATLVFTALAVASLLRIRHPALRIATCLVPLLGVIAVGVSRIELGVHWTTDVMASIVAVSGWLMAIAILFGPRLSTPASDVPPLGVLSNAPFGQDDDAANSPNEGSTSSN